MAFNFNNRGAWTFWIKLQRLTRGSGRRKIFVVLWITIFVAATVLLYRFHSNRRHDRLVLNLQRRLIHYCNPPGPVLGNEQFEPMEYAQFKLKQVQVVVRHGDRSSVALKFPTSNPSHFNCKLNSNNSHNLKKIQTLKKMEKIFKKTRLRSDGNHITENFLLHEKQRCKAGQLTPKGFLQHFHLGEYVYNVYGRKLDISLASVEMEEILAFATPVERTQQSAVAFFSGMLQSVYKKLDSPENAPQMKIRVSPDRLGIFREDENGQVAPCPRLNQVLWQSRENSNFKSGLAKIEPLMKTFSHLFNISRSKLLPVTWIGDLIIARHCHHHPPVCGPHGCIDNKIKAETVRACDWAFATNYTPPARILSHPVLSKVFNRMVLKASGEEHKKFVLFSTHDSTVIPILVNLGIYTNIWVPYASRIVFELWEAGGLLGTKLKGDDLDKHFVRVLFNGRDYTRKIRMCKSSLKFGKLCSLRTFVKDLEGATDSMEANFMNLCHSMTS